LCHCDLVGITKYRPQRQQGSAAIGNIHRISKSAICVIDSTKIISGKIVAIAGYQLPNGIPWEVFEIDRCCAGAATCGNKYERHENGLNETLHVGFLAIDKSAGLKREHASCKKHAQVQIAIFINQLEILRRGWFVSV